MKLINKLNSYCGPFKFYLVTFIVSLVIVLYQNLETSQNEFCVGNKRCKIYNNYSKLHIILAKVVGGSFWLFVLHNLCVYNYKTFAWAIVLLPWLVAALMIGILVGQGVLQ